jgi:steroid delta-isomerase-like uncharacterized protein
MCQLDSIQTRRFIMNPKENENIVRRYLELVLGKEDIATAADFLAENFLCYEPGEEAPAGRDADIEQIKAFRAAFPDQRLSDMQITSEGDKVYVRSIYEGTHLGNFAGMPASRNRISAPYAMQFRVVNGKIVEERDDYDIQDFMRQLGATYTEERGGL